jgi:hypothetical protein
MADAAPNHDSAVLPYHASYGWEGNVKVIKKLVFIVVYFIFFYWGDTL